MGAAAAEAHIPSAGGVRARRTVGGASRAQVAHAMADTWQPGRERPPETGAGPHVRPSPGVAHVPAAVQLRHLRAAQHAVRSKRVVDHAMRLTPLVDTSYARRAHAAPRSSGVACF